LIFLNVSIFPQVEPVIKINIQLTDDSYNIIQDLYIGVDPAGTDTLDEFLGEADLPPIPPDEFDARLVIPPYETSNITSLIDIRGGEIPFSGTVNYRVKYQQGEGARVILRWNLSENITGQITDVFGGIVVNAPMLGRDSLYVDNPIGINQLNIDLTYNNVSTDVYSELPVINSYFLSQNFPNPFNPSTTINYVIPEPGKVTIKVYDILGNETAALVNSEMPAGMHSVVFNARNLSSGVYFYKIWSRNYSETKKMIINK
jgi:hypothetical protein